MGICHAGRQPVVTQGGLTGCVNGAVSAPDEIILSLERMKAIEAVDASTGTAIVQAGVILQSLQERADGEGLLFPLDLGARGSCTIGGNIATNAGGISVLRYGMMRNLVLGLEVVTADGSVLSSMNRMLKNNAGYDIKQIFIGSEGTLGIVTRAVLKLYPRPVTRNTALVALDGFDEVVTLLNATQRDLAGTLSAYEVMWGCYVLGHIADGNLHLFVRPGTDGDLHDESDAIVYGALDGFDGSVSAEHGIGAEKMKWLGRSRSATEIEFMRVLKRSFDPLNLLNRGRVLPDEP